MSTISASTTSTTAFKVTADTTGTLVLQTGATPTTAMTLDASQNVTFAGYANLPNTFGFKNRIINGAMMIDQRNAGASVTPTTGQFLVDRFKVFLSQASKFTAQQNAGSVTPPAGFVNYLGITSSSAYSSVSTDYFLMSHQVEGLNVSDLAWGTASAATVTLSFWVRSSLTGTFGGAVGNSASNRNYPFTFTVSSANTWEQKTVTIAGDTSGTWLTTNGVGLSLKFNLGSGSNFLTTAGAWASGDYVGPTGATSVVGTNGATFYITGVQLEKGSTATSFDFRDYGRELILCQRYYETSESIFYGSATGQYWSVPFSVVKRAGPTVTRTGTGSITASTTGTSVYTVTAYAPSMFFMTTATSPYISGGAWTASAEL